MTKSLTRIICAAGVLAIAGCNSPNPVQGLRVTEVLLFAPGGNGLTVGDVVQARLQANLSDGTETDVTAYGRYTSMDTSVLTVSETGVITAVGAGSTEIRAGFGDKDQDFGFLVREP